MKAAPYRGAAFVLLFSGDTTLFVAGKTYDVPVLLRVDVRKVLAVIPVRPAVFSVEEVCDRSKRVSGRGKFTSVG